MQYSVVNYYAWIPQLGLDVPRLPPMQGRGAKAASSQLCSGLNRIGKSVRVYRITTGSPFALRNFHLQFRSLENVHALVDIRSIN